MATKPQAAKQASKTPAKSNVPAVQKGGAMILQQDQVPDFIKQGQARGSEQVGLEDLVIPRLVVLQELSPTLKSKDPHYNPDAEVGMLMNSVTGELYGEEVYVVPVHYTKQWLVWRDQKAGGGFLGAFNSQEEAQARINQEPNKNGLEAIDTPQHMCLLMNRRTGELDEIMLSMPRTKAKVSRQWNSMIRLTGQDRFARVYKVTTVEESKNNNDYYNFAVTSVGFPSKEVYSAAEKLYQRIASGEKKIVMHVDDDADDEGRADSEM